MVEPRFETQSIPSASYHALGYGASSILLILVRKIPNLSLNFHQFCKVAWLGLLLTSGCIRLERISPATPSAVEVPTAQVTLVSSATSTPDYGWEDVNNLMDSVCFEYAESATGQVFRISNAAALDAFYTQIDHSQLCEDPVNRMSYPFNNNEMIVGLWNSGIGCTARYEVQNVQRDNAQKQEAIQLKFIIEGDCPYDLVQPFWIALPQSADVAIQISVQK
jgi:hypothetical protein